MLSWQSVMIFYILSSSLMMIWYRRVSLANKKNFFLVGLLVYFMVAANGLVLTLIKNSFILPPLPLDMSGIFILLAGTLIPISWLTNYKLISNIGAFSTAIASSLNFVLIAIFGALFLSESITPLVFIGGLFMVISAIIAVSASESRTKRGKDFKYNAALLVFAILTLSFGIMFEKLAIDGIGVWNYAFYGWLMQFITAIVLFIIFGRKELRIKDKTVVKNALIAGALTAFAGTLFIYALSQGYLSSVALSASARVSLTAFLAIWLLKERKYITQRMFALSLTIIGLMFMFN